MCTKIRFLCLILKNMESQLTTHSRTLISKKRKVATIASPLSTISATTPTHSKAQKSLLMKKSLQSWLVRHLWCQKLGKRGKFRKWLLSESWMQNWIWKKFTIKWALVNAGNLFWGFFHLPTGKPQQISRRAGRLQDGILASPHKIAITAILRLVEFVKIPHLVAVTETPHQVGTTPPNLVVKQVITLQMQLGSSSAYKIADGSKAASTNQATLFHPHRFQIMKRWNSQTS